MSLLFVGSYWPDRALTLAPTVGDFVVLGFPELFLDNGHGWPGGTYARLREANLKVITGPAGLEQDDVLNVDGRLDRVLGAMKATLVAHDALDLLLAMMPHEEWYLHLKAGHLDHWPLVAQHKASRAHEAPEAVYVDMATSLCTALSGVADAIHRVFPGLPVGHVEPWWENDPGAGFNYHPVPPSYDFLGVDAYVQGAITRERWEEHVGRAYAATARYGKPILMVPQTFVEEQTDPTSTFTPLWSEMPTVEQLGWWGELVDRHPTIAACAYFCLEHPTEYDARHVVNGVKGKGLSAFPDRLAAVQAYWEGGRDA